MSDTTTVRSFIRRRNVRYGVGVVAAELVLVIGYFALTPSEPTSVRYVVYPLVWINAALWVAMRARPRPASSRQRWTAVSVAGGYFLLLALLAGLIGFSPHAYIPEGIYISIGSPGWGPRISYVASTYYLVFVPYRVVGYLALAYLVYDTVLVATKAALSGVFGLVSCVSCSFPLLEMLFAGASGAAIAASGYSLDLSTAVFLVTVGLLVWRPGTDEKLGG